MPGFYKVFLVEDEVAIRKGIRSIIDWAAAGFEFCGEAPDGEIALPLIQTTRPDLLITDIKMPFMDGLQLSRLVHESIPEMKIIILSGHDEFKYAQEAIQIGVTDYLLKPITPHFLMDVLQKVADQLNREQRARASLQELKKLVENNQRDIFLSKLIRGSILTPEVIETSRQLKIDILAGAYQVMSVKAELDRLPSNPATLAERDQITTILIQAAEHQPDIIAYLKDVEETVFIIKGETPLQVEQQSYFLSRLLKDEVESKIDCLLTIGIGGVKERLGDISKSFVEAHGKTRNLDGQISLSQTPEPVNLAELQKIDDVRVEHFIKTGLVKDIDIFYAAAIEPFCQTLLTYPAVRYYFYVNLMVIAYRFISKMGGDPNAILPQLQQQPVTVIGSTQTAEQMKAMTRRILQVALEFRDKNAGKPGGDAIQKAQQYINDHFADTEISLNVVAAQVSLSPNHFSVLFSKETRESFVEYLTRKRIEKARELLRTTNMTANDISFTVGYNTPRYFYSLFKKVTGCSPTEYRQAAQSKSHP